jgi:hypothetical protein
LNPKNKNPPSLAGHSLALVRQVYCCQIVHLDTHQRQWDADSSSG